MPHSAQSAIRIYRYHPAIFASVFTQRQTGIRSAVDVATHGKRKIQSTIHFHQLVDSVLPVVKIKSV